MIYDNKNYSNKLETSYTNSDHKSLNEQAETTSSTSKRRSQVKNACVNCQKACKKCDEGRPCQRCIKLGITDTCLDSPRKERKKGFKRGPYRKKSVTTQHISPKKESTSLPLFTTSIMVKTEQTSPSSLDAATLFNMNNEYYDYPASTDTISSQLMGTPNNYYSNNTPNEYCYPTYEDCPQESLTIGLPNWTYTDTVEHQLYYNTHDTSSFVTKFGDNAIFLQNDKPHLDDSIYNDQQWLDNLYYYPSNMMYINVNPSTN